MNFLGFISFLFPFPRTKSSSSRTGSSGTIPKNPQEPPQKSGNSGNSEIPPHREGETPKPPNSRVFSGNSGVFLGIFHPWNSPRLLQVLPRKRSRERKEIPSFPKEIPNFLKGIRARSGCGSSGTTCTCAGGLGIILGKKIPKIS